MKTHEDILNNRIKMARYKMNACILQTQNEEYKYWQGYLEGLEELRESCIEMDDNHAEEAYERRMQA